MDTQQTFAAWLRAHLDERGVSQAQLASYINARPQTVSAWLKHGAKPNMESSAALAKWLHVEHDEVLRAAGQKPPLPSDGAGRPESKIIPSVRAILEEMSAEEQQKVLLLLRAGVQMLSER